MSNRGLKIIAPPAGWVNEHGPPVVEYALPIYVLSVLVFRHLLFTILALGVFVIVNLIPTLRGQLSRFRAFHSIFWSLC
jgi:hypothetical protein